MSVATSAALSSMATMSVSDLKEERRKCFEEVSVALEALSVKQLNEFRMRVEVPRPVQSVAVASVCMIARVDDTVQVGADGLPTRTWEAAAASMSKPGHFVNSLRQFPYAVDSGRMPDINISSAMQCLEDVSPEHLTNEPTALRLHEWVLSAMRYCEIVQMVRLQTSVSGPQNSAQPDSFSHRAGYALSTPPTSPEHPSTFASLQEVSGETPGKVMRSSMGSSVGGSNSVFGRSPIGDPSPSADSVRSSRPSGGRGGAQALGGGRGRGNKVPARRSTDTTTSSFKISPSGSPTSAASRTPPSRASPSQSSTMPRRQPRISGGPRSNVGIEDWQQKLEQMRREAREMKAMEGQLKWAMKRDEDKLIKRETEKDAKDVMQWRQEQVTDLAECAADRERQEKNGYLEESRMFQEFKRDAKSREFKRDAERVKQEYIEKKENSEFVIDLKRSQPIEERKQIIDANLERYTLVSMHNIEESQREQIEMKMAREDEEEMSLGLEMMEARRERDEALKSLELFRAQQRISMPLEMQIPSRPFKASGKSG